MPNKEERDFLFREKLSFMLEEMPPICTTYFRARISLSAESAVSYAYKLQYFFMYLIDKIPYFTNKDIREITPEELSKLTSEEMDGFSEWLYAHRDIKKIEKNSKKNSLHTQKQNSIKIYLSCINSFFVFLKKRGYIDSNPMDLIERGPKHQKKDEIIRLYSDEKKKFMDSITNGNGLNNRQLIYHEKNKLRDKAIYQLFLDTGLRISELQGINLEDVNYFEHYVYVARKENRYSCVYFSDYTQQCINDYLGVRQQYYPTDDERALFLSNKGTRISIRTIQAMTKKYSQAAIPGKASKISPHKLRATYASDFLKATDGNLDLTAMQLGHTSTDVTRVYAETDRETRSALRNLLSE